MMHQRGPGLRPATRTGAHGLCWRRWEAVGTSDFPEGKWLCSGQLGNLGTKDQRKAA